jgi:hypothetical protein
LQNGYTKDGDALGEKSYINIYRIDNIYDVWVTFNFDKNEISVYKEYECGGEIARDTINIEAEWLCDLDTFIEGVDRKLEFWIG